MKRDLLYIKIDLLTQHAWRAVLFVSIRRKYVQNRSITRGLLTMHTSSSSAPKEGIYKIGEGGGASTNSGLSIGPNVVVCRGGGCRSSPKSAQILRECERERHTLISESNWGCQKLSQISTIAHSCRHDIERVCERERHTDTHMYT